MRFFDVLQAGAVKPKGLIITPPQHLARRGALSMLRGSGWVDGVMQSTVVDMGNTSKFFFEESTKERWIMSDFPRPVPPFEHTWLEAPMPKFARMSKNKVTEFPYRQWGMERYGLYIWRMAGSTLSSVDEYVEFAPGVDAPIHTHKISPGSLGAKWALRITLMLLRAKNEVCGPLCTWDLPLGSNGEPLIVPLAIKAMGDATSAEEYTDPPIRYPSELTKAELDGTYAAAQEGSKFLKAGLFALSLMNCKNTVTELVEPPPKLDKKHVKRYGKGLCTYRVIKVQAQKPRGGKRVNRANGDRAVPSLHLKRGHFKHFGEAFGTKKLFGKWSGTYWWDDLVAGSIESGMVEHDYEVEGPNE